MKVSSYVVDSFHSMLMDDDQFNEALMRCALDVARHHLSTPGGPEFDEDDVMDLAAELTTRVTAA